MRLNWRSSVLAAAGAGALCVPAMAAAAVVPAPPPPAAAASYADLVDLADSARLVVRANIRSVSRVPAERAPGVRAGFGRFLVKAKTRALLTGEAPIGEAIRYLVDLPLDRRGKPPALGKKEVLLFARAVPGKPGELQLVAPDAQVVWSEPVEQRVRAIATELLAPDAPGRVSGVREVIHVPGTLAGEGETQIFFTTWDGSAASATVRQRPGQPFAWGVSFSELMADVGNPPQPETLAWYRLACFLPNALPVNANLSEGHANRMQAEADYRTMLGALGPCLRTRK